MKEGLIRRDDVMQISEHYKQILDAESHHDHPIADVNGVLRWVDNPSVTKILECISLNDLCPLLNCLGYGKNSEIYRKLYRDMGYSLSGYWEVFYWDWNNEEVNEYKPEKAS